MKACLAILAVPPVRGQMYAQKLELDAKIANFLNAYNYHVELTRTVCTMKYTQK